MKVFIVWELDEYDAVTIHGVYSSRKGAEQKSLEIWPEQPQWLNNIQEVFLDDIEPNLGE